MDITTVHHIQDVKRQDRVGGLHFFNPVPVMKLLEVVKADQTSEATMEAMISWGRAIGELSGGIQQRFMERGVPVWGSLLKYQ